MAEIRIYGWKSGANKIGAIKINKEYCRLELNDAKLLIERSTTGTLSISENGDQFFTNSNPEIVNVLFTKRTEFIRKMKEKGF